MRLACWLAVARQLDDLIDLLLRDGRLTAPPGPDLAQLGQPVLGKARAPRAHRRGLHSQPLGDLRVRDPVTGQQQRFRALDLSMRCRLGSRQHLQRLALPVGHGQRAAALFTHADYH